MEQYNLPFYQKSNFKWSTNLMYLFLTIITGGMAFVSLAFMTEDEPFMGLFAGLFMLALSSFLGYMYIAAGVLKKFHIEMTSECIKFSLPFKSRKIYWREIHSAQICKYNNNTMILILLEKDLHKKTKRTVANNFNSIYGFPPSSFQIPMRFFMELDAEKLLNTIGEQASKADRTGVVNVENLNDDNQENENSLAKAIIFSFLLSLLTGIVYGFSINKLEKNFVAIPILGTFFIIAVFNKYYLEKSFNLMIRFLVGLICLIQIPTAVIVTILVSAKLSVNTSNIVDAATAYFTYILQNPLKQITVIIVGIACFGIGAINGRRKFEKLKS